MVGRNHDCILLQNWKYRKWSLGGGSRTKHGVTSDEGREAGMFHSIRANPPALPDSHFKHTTTYTWDGKATWHREIKNDMIWWNHGFSIIASRISSDESLEACPSLLKMLTFARQLVVTLSQPSLTSLHNWIIRKFLVARSVVFLHAQHTRRSMNTKTDTFCLGFIPNLAQAMGATCEHFRFILSLVRSWSLLWEATNDTKLRSRRDTGIHFQTMHLIWTWWFRECLRLLHLPIMFSVQIDDRIQRFGWWIF